MTLHADLVSATRVLQRLHSEGALPINVKYLYSVPASSTPQKVGAESTLVLVTEAGSRADTMEYETFKRKCETLSEQWTDAIEVSKSALDEAFAESPVQLRWLAGARAKDFLVQASQLGTRGPRALNASAKQPTRTRAWPWEVEQVMARLLLGVPNKFPSIAPEVLIVRCALLSKAGLGYGFSGRGLKIDAATELWSAETGPCVAVDCAALESPSPPVAAVRARSRSRSRSPVVSPVARLAVAPPVIGNGFANEDLLCFED